MTVPRKLGFYDFDVEFNEISLLSFSGKDGEPYFSMDPSELTSIYGAYHQMKKEEREQRREEKCAGL